MAMGACRRPSPASTLPATVHARHAGRPQKRRAGNLPPDGDAAMNPLKKPLHMTLVALVIVQLSACSRTVQWEEEVPLNTGETIWVKRSGTYSFGSESGNPLRFGYNPDWRSTIEFTYRGKEFFFSSEASPMVLAISPHGQPNLVASAGVWGNQHAYPCITPYYVQFRPDNSGKKWTWPVRIEPWLYDLPSNLLVGLPPLEHDGKKINALERKRLNGSILIYSEYQRIDPAKKPENCMSPKTAGGNQNG